MNGRGKMVFRAVAILVVVWVVVLVLVEMAARRVPTPENIQRYIEGNPLEEKSQGEREAVVREVARQVNGLSYEQRDDFRDGEGPRPEENAFLARLTDTEKVMFIELTMDETFKKMMERFNAMEPDDRQSLVDKTLRDLKREGIREEGREWLEGLDPELYSKLVATGLESFYEDADANTKIDLAPLIEKMDERMRWK